MFLVAHRSLVGPRDRDREIGLHLSLLGNAAREEGKYDLATRLYRQAMSGEREMRISQTGLAVIAYCQGDSATARRHLAAALKAGAVPAAYVFAAKLSKEAGAEAESRGEQSRDEICRIQSQRIASTSD
jgi:hypothetical protein